MSVHVPVMRDEVLKVLKPSPHKIYIDATFGAGGYSRAILEFAEDVHVVALDRDPDAIERGAHLKEKYPRHFSLYKTCFGDMKSAVPKNAYDGIVFDLGVSSPQFDEISRGFSFRGEGPLDMRMSQSGPTASDLVNTKSEEELADIIYRYGDERKSRRIAKAIVEARREIPFSTTQELADLVRRVVPSKPGDIDAATRTFQALRIAVNDELGELERGLEASEELLSDGGRLVVVSFHSLEDRIVKEFFKSRAGRMGQGSRHVPLAEIPQKPTFKLAETKVIAASREETENNPRARSAKLRWGIRTREEEMPCQ
ncbi:16S rRNA (cytosine(1402)-N(4))-methyltransferase [Candidatus Bealeia paramacronuclearis]|uniref:Ribosomal RNA small subunit methyltransferase H n=1 Tax=Candidatus Bealeia paramacronuclearis TaxID=1921001 RepID=A0ABZ2C0Y9_9PROT|nr:16S rRNA (cytosine(1402)-N(4))-methyltransferase [Candidatus Bealeia paramacronuclearis]